MVELNIPATRTPWDAIKVPTQTQGIVGEGLRSFTKSNFRVNLGRLTGINPTNAHAHHVFAQKFGSQFSKLGINVHNPNYGAWWEATSHLSNASAYNSAWTNFFASSPTQSGVFQLARDLSKQYGITIRF